jgi:hypothetical protein
MPPRSSRACGPVPPSGLVRGRPRPGTRRRGIRGGVSISDAYAVESPSGSVIDNVGGSVRSSISTVISSPVSLSRQRTGEVAVAQLDNSIAIKTET